MKTYRIQKTKPRVDVDNSEKAFDWGKAVYGRASEEDLEHWEVDEGDLEKFRKINALSDEEQERRCAFYDDCSICPMAIHKILLSTTKHICVQGMTEEKFRIEMDSISASF